MVFTQLNADFCYITAHDPVLPLKTLVRGEKELRPQDAQMLASISRITAVACAAAIFFVSSSWITCGIVWILSHDLYRMANYLHDGQESAWIKKCSEFKIWISFGVVVAKSFVSGEGIPKQQESARRVFWNEVKKDLISFKLYNAIKKQLS